MLLSKKVITWHLTEHIKSYVAAGCDPSQVSSVLFFSRLSLSGSFLKV